MTLALIRAVLHGYATMLDSVVSVLDMRLKEQRRAEKQRVAKARQEDALADFRRGLESL